jgi:hypothetical protein
VGGSTFLPKGWGVPLNLDPSRPMYMCCLLCRKSFHLLTFFYPRKHRPQDTHYMSRDIFLQSAFLFPSNFMLCNVFLLLHRRFPFQARFAVARLFSQVFFEFWNHRQNSRIPGCVSWYIVHVWLIRINDSLANSS